MDASLTAKGVADALRVPEENVLELRPARLSPQHLDFIGLVRANEQEHLVPEAVVMHEGQPFVYILNYHQVPAVSEVELQRSMRLLGLRADAPYAAVIRPGVVQVYTLGNIRENHAPIAQSTKLEPSLFARLIVGAVPTRSSKETTCGAHELMLALLNSVTDHLVNVRQINASEALALVGRALFMRFLGDRGIVPLEQPLCGVSHIRNCFETPAAAAATCNWLDTTFNGDLLELPGSGSLGYFQNLHSSSGGSALKDLTAIMCGDRPLGEGVYQTQFSWGDLHFSYVPVGLLSQVYEVFAHRFDKTSAKGNSVYYTPRHLAEYLLDHSFSLLGPEAHKARVLDPASGGGVFLLAAFRRLVKGRWQATGVKPNTKVIREILNKQLVGFDINPAARQLTALALYLTALELDSDAADLKDLVFTPLQDTVLIPAEQWDVGQDIALGSLAPGAIAQFEGAFDLVIGNPPWTSTKNPERRERLNEVAAQHMIHRGIEPCPNPDGVPDLPFVWAATRFAKSDAVLAFALHGRLLTKITKPGHDARIRIFQGLDVKYILNGMELRNTEVWPSMTAHFCLLLAHNRRSTEHSEFFAVTPVEDQSLNREGRIRIDSKDAWTSDVAKVEKNSHLFKTLAKGNALDIELLDRIEELCYPSLRSYLDMLDIPATHGYQTRQVGTDGVNASFLLRMKDLPTAPNINWYVAPVSEFKGFSFDRVHRTREEKNYAPPLVFLRESPSSKPGHPLSFISYEEVAYSRSFIGYSCAGASNPELLAVYLSSIFNSKLFLYFTLMTSSKIGCERSTLQKYEAELFPVSPLEDLELEQLEQLCRIKTLLSYGGVELEREIESFVSKLYKLRIADQNLIQDRLAFSLPFKDVRTNAIKSIDRITAETFRGALSSALEPFDISDTPLAVEFALQDSDYPWYFIRLGPSNETKQPNAEFIMTAIGLGDELDASLVEVSHEQSLYVGILNQRRYWSRTSARTLALDLIKRGHPVLSRGFQ
ncbi:MAG: SAM-dependent methyltransferase [Gammaproteobacteria bacterium]|nr:SAM-dependent methyltransferase [Gammaproteobacteria bacterium]MBU0883222.1 SAM-dependent methyltransferase [Gammaproteobacteria bacterium]MBU1860245.1 SAM-dependent methyltransferase [Gammaproteobacteria bacterium]